MFVFLIFAITVVRKWSVKQLWYVNSDNMSLKNKTHRERGEEKEHLDLTQNVYVLRTAN